MKVIADTCVWSEALRRNSPINKDVTDLLVSLIDDECVPVMEPIHREILSGVKFRSQFDRLGTSLSAFPDLHIETSDYMTAA